MVEAAPGSCTELSQSTPMQLKPPEIQCGVRGGETQQAATAHSQTPGTVPCGAKPQQQG